MRHIATAYVGRRRAGGGTRRRFLTTRGGRAVSTVNQLRAENIEQIARWMAEYVRAGHQLTFTTRCGDEPDDNEIVFRIADWGAFSRLMGEGAAPDVLRSA